MTMNITARSKEEDQSSKSPVLRRLYAHDINKLRKDEQRLNSFEQYRNTWRSKAQTFMTARLKLNRSEVSKNHKVNTLQTSKDQTLIERVDSILEKKKHKDFAAVALRPELNHNVDWECSLRQNEIDYEYDGIVFNKSKDKSANQSSFTKKNSKLGFTKHRQFYD
jgi:hypothetical protein